MANNTSLMAGKRGLVMGVANDRSIAWGIARVLHKHGAEIAFTCQGSAFEKRVRPLAVEVGSKLVFPCDVGEPESQKMVFDKLQQQWGALDFIVHSLAYSDRDELNGRYVDTTLNNFIRTMHISCFSFTETACLARPFMVGTVSYTHLTLPTKA